MEMRKGLAPRSERTHSTGTRRRLAGCNWWPGKFCWLSAVLFALMGVHAATIQLLSVGATSPFDQQLSSADSGLLPRMSESFGRLPLNFEAADNDGSTFFCRGMNSSLWLSPIEAVLTIESPRKRHRNAAAVVLSGFP